MKTLRFIFIILLLTVSGYSTDTNPNSSDPNEQFNSNRLYVAFEDKTSGSRFANIVDRFSGKIIKELNSFSFPVYLVEISETSGELNSLKKTINKLENEPGVIFVSDGKNDKSLMNIEKASVSRQGGFGISKPNKITTTTHLQNTTNNFHGIILNHFPGLYSCIEKHNRLVKKIKISVLYEITIDKKGGVKRVRLLKGNIKDPKIRKCLKTKISAWKDFPRRSDPQDLTVKFKFKY